MSSEPAIRLENIGKCYHIYDKPRDRLLQMLFRGRRRYYREFWALRGVNLSIMPGEVVGVIGKNGAGKSTLLQLVCGTLNPSTGIVSVQGRVAALLELGAGFNPEFSGRENVFLSAAINGLTYEEIVDRYEEIVEFSGIRDFIDQPVKTYSSGMYVRLAFSVAINVDPDILIIDEALSVGDGEFARKSFDRIMALRDKGTTILFCSHSMYQVEAFCARALWLNQGKIVALGNAKDVVPDYNAFLLGDKFVAVSEALTITPQSLDWTSLPMNGQACITNVEVSLDGISGRFLKGELDNSTLSIKVNFGSDPNLPIPVVGATIDYGPSITVTSVISSADRIVIQRDSFGYGSVEIIFPKLNLRRGKYQISIYLACENALHIYDRALAVAELEMKDTDPEIGFFKIEHWWRNNS